MKYLYRILRLFFCPHKYVTQDTINVTWENYSVPYKIIYRQECRYCGKPNNYTVS